MAASTSLDRPESLKALPVSGLLIGRSRAFDDGSVSAIFESEKLPTTSSGTR